MHTIRHIFIAITLTLATTISLSTVTPAQTSVPPGQSETLDNADIQEMARDILRLGTLERNSLMARLVERDNTDVVPALIQSLRFMGQDPWTVVAALQSLTGAGLSKDWNKWMLWQEAHPEIKPFEGFAAYKEWVFANIDPNFSLLLYDGIARTIRLEEITWGGVPKDGIPALVNPKLVAPGHDDAKYLGPDELVFGVSINGDVRAYPLRMLDWHEMFNDVIGGVPVALAYCTLCGSGILFETEIAGRAAPFEFGSSGFLYRSNKLMYDKATNSLWNQFTGKPVAGDLVGSDIELKVRPVAITTWQKWLARHPDTTVLSLDTGFDRDYTPGRPYASYFNSPDLMFPAQINDTRLEPKDYVFALRLGTAEKAWSLNLFAEEMVLNDTIGDQDVVLVGDPDSRTVCAYETGGITFAAYGENTQTLVGPDDEWRITEAALISPDNRQLARLPGHIAYWFAWQNFRPDAETRIE